MYWVQRVIAYRSTRVGLEEYMKPELEVPKRKEKKKIKKKKRKKNKWG